MILGIDVAIRRTGIVLIDPDKKTVPLYTAFNYKEPFDDSYTAALKHRDAIVDFFSTNILPNIDCTLGLTIAVESILTGGHYFTAIKLAVAKTNYFHAIDLLNTKYNLSIPLVKSITVNSWKKALIGRTNASKEEIKAVLYKQYANVYKVPRKVWDDKDLLDAFALGLYVAGG